MFRCTLLYVHSLFAIILMWKRELIVFLVSSDGFVAFPPGVLGLSAICESGIS